jgi:hypothetical protein
MGRIMGAHRHGAAAPMFALLMQEAPFVRTRYGRSPTKVSSGTLSQSREAL